MKKNCDFILLATVIILVLYGLVMVFSASYPDGLANMKGNPYHFISKQAKFALLGIIIMIVVMNIPIVLFKRLSIPIFLASLILQMTLFTSLGRSFGTGATRWIKVAGVVIMPAEFLKFGAIMGISRFMSVSKNDISKFGKPLFTALIVFCGIPGILVFKTDFSNSVVLLLTLAIIMFIAGLNYIFVPIAVSGLAGVIYMISKVENFRQTRLISFIDPFKYKLSGGYQLIQSLYAFAYGGIAGAGLGKSIQKYYYLPEAYNDFVFAIIGEELGLIGCLMTIFFYMIILWRGTKIAIGCKDKYSAYLATGIIALITVQALIHMGVSLGLLPTTGLPLPFISYGGTSLLIFLGAMGLLLGISKNSQ